MKIYFIRILGICFMLMNVSFMLGQVSIKANVVDENRTPVTGAIIQFTNGNQKILGYGITDNKGDIEIKLSNAPDSIWLECSHTSFGSQYLMLIKPYEIKNPIIMSGNNYQLEEVLIKARNFERKGDSLIYNINATKKLGDRTLEDVLKNIPGIDIKSNGNILYEGLPISKFMIEGMDLLGSSYAIATKNLPLPQLKEIEILEKHQHIKALKGIDQPDNAAINIKLKSETVITHKIDGGLGASNGSQANNEPNSGSISPTLQLLKKSLYDINGSGFAFRKKEQLSVILGSNNNGRDQSYALNRGGDTQFGDILSIPLLNGTTSGQPPIEYRKVNRGSSILGKINFLRKLNSEYELKIEGGATRDLNYEESTRTSRYTDQASTRIFLDAVNKINTKYHHVYKATMEKNTVNNYSLSSILLDLEPTKIMANNTFNMKPIDELVKRGPSKIDFKNEGVIKISNAKTLKYKLEARYIDFEEEISISPTSFNIPSFANNFLNTIDTTINGAYQQLRRKTWTANISSTFIKSFHQNINLQLLFGIKYKNQGLTSQLYNEGAEFNSIGVNTNEKEVIQYANDNVLTSFLPYVNSAFNINFKGIKIYIRIPFTYNNSQIVNNPASKANNDTYNGLIYKPSLVLKYMTRDDHDFDLSYSLSHNISEPFAYQTGYILASHRNLRINPNKFFTYDDHNINFGYSKTNHEARREVKISASHNFTINPITSVNVYDENGQTTGFSELKNIVKSINFNLNFSQGFLGKKAKVSSRIGCRKSTYTQINNNALQDINSVGYNSQISLEYIMKNQFFTLSAKLSNDKTSLDQQSFFQAYEVNFYQELPKGYNVNLSYTNQQATGYIKNDWMHLMDIKIKKELPKKKIDFSLTLSNLLNQKTYQNILVYDFFQENTITRLRERQLFLSVNRYL